MERETSPRAATAATDEPVGLIAGWGRYPIVVAEALGAAGRPVVTALIHGHADGALRGLSSHSAWFGLARLGGILAHFRRHGVRQVTMAGKIHKKILFRPLQAWRHFVPDWTGLRTFGPYFAGIGRDLKDDSLLGAVARRIEALGMELRPATDYCPGLLIDAGVLTRREPSAAEWSDIQFGWGLAKDLGRIDVGQSVVVKNRAAMAVEAIEGTDECLRRGGALGGTGCTVVKVAKPQQDMRFDVPTVGRGTIETMIEIGASCLAVEAGRTIVIDDRALLELADRHGIAIVSLVAGRLPAVDGAATERSGAAA
jgi:hypothetical protein